MDNGVKYVTCPTCGKDGVPLEYQQPDPLTGENGGWLLAWNVHPDECGCGLTTHQMEDIEDKHVNDPSPMA
jgi:hypothetical protein